MPFLFAWEGHDRSGSTFVKFIWLKIQFCATLWPPQMLKQPEMCNGSGYFYSGFLKGFHPWTKKKTQKEFQLRSSYLNDLLVHVRWELDHDSVEEKKGLSELLKGHGKWLALTVVKHFIFHSTFISLFEHKLYFSPTKAGLADIYRGLLSSSSSSSVYKCLLGEMIQIYNNSLSFFFLFFFWQCSFSFHVSKKKPHTNVFFFMFYPSFV